MIHIENCECIQLRMRAHVWLRVTQKHRTLAFSFNGLRLSEIGIDNFNNIR